MEAYERHNQLARETFIKIIRDTQDNEPEALVVLESVLLGMMLHSRPDPRHAGEFMDTMTARVIERMKR